MTITNHTQSSAGHEGMAANGFFTEREWHTLQTEDKAAGRAVIGLMVGIFSIGVLLYTIVAYAAM